MRQPIVSRAIDQVPGEPARYSFELKCGHKVVIENPATNGPKLEGVHDFAGADVKDCECAACAACDAPVVSPPVEDAPKKSKKQDA